MGVLDLSEGASNTLKDSSGVLLYSNSDHDAVTKLNLGGNSFQLLDSSGTYIERAGDEDPTYITGNYFYPSSVADTNFLDYMDPDAADNWIYTYLRVENLNDTVIAEPGDSIEFQTLAYLQNYLGTAEDDTITEVAFKYKVLPGDTGWTTRRVDTVSQDSIYSWWVNIGDNGGLVSYVFWAKDSHGRFVTTPFGADTTNPSNGQTHFTSFEMTNYTISGDSVTIWAPTTISQTVTVTTGGKLVIKPWPGAADHTVKFAEDAGITVYNNGSYPRMWIQGTSSMPITFAPVSDTVAWDVVRLLGGSLYADNAIFRVSTYGVEAPGQGTVVVQFNNCVFDSILTYLV